MRWRRLIIKDGGNSVIGDAELGDVVNQGLVGNKWVRRGTIGITDRC